MTDNLLIDNNKVVYSQDSIRKWELEIDKIKFIGEYTFGFDYYFVFAENKEEWLLASTMDIDHEKFWVQLGEKLECKFAPSLFANIDKWESNVMFPEKLENHKLFNVVKKEEPKTIWEKIVRYFSGNERIELTDEVLELFND